MKKTTIITMIIIVTIITISIIYNTIPRLQLNGSKNITISYKEKYIDPGVIIKNAKGNYMNKIKVESNIDNKKIGDYYIDYSIKIGNKKLYVRRNVKIIDDVSPIIKLKGEKKIEIDLNSTYKEPGYIAIDEIDGDITEKVKIEGEVNTKKPGNYTIKYIVFDHNLNKTEINRTVKVKKSV